MIITISGLLGSGKSTVAKALAKKLGWQYYGMGELRRRAAEEAGLTLEEYNKLGESDIKTDLLVDEFQKKLGETEDNIIVEGRLSWYFIPQSFKIFLTVEPKEGAHRIYEACLNGRRASESDEFSSEQFVLEANERRMASDRKRYQQYFQIDPYKPEYYDFVLDTTDFQPSETFAKVWGEVSKKINSPLERGGAR